MQSTALHWLLGAPSQPDLVQWNTKLSATEVTTHMGNGARSIEIMWLIYSRSYSTTEKSLTWWQMGSWEASLWLLVGTRTRRVNTFPSSETHRILEIDCHHFGYSRGVMPVLDSVRAGGSSLTQWQQKTLQAKGQGLHCSKLQNSRGVKYGIQEMEAFQTLTILSHQITGHTLRSR